MSWRQFVLRLGDLNAEDVENIMLRHGALAVTFTDAADDPVLEPKPGETPLWNETRLTALFPDATDFALISADLVATLGLSAPPAYRVEPLEERVWEREWMKDFGPMRFGRRLWVVPTDADPPAQAGVVVRLDPGLAFGTGSHATTALCLEQLERLLTPLAANEKRVLDFGCGSGILAIAALKLGAREAVAIDIDPQAVAATQRNATLNGVEQRLHACLASASEDCGGFDLVVANILAKPLTEMAEALTDRLKEGGSLLLSGILENQADALARAYGRFVEFESPAQRDGWMCLTGRRTAS
ncbi:MAG: 50S ribosomal protein L11 methyltransferase [Woeseiaceae bacterium]|nr:50S ribosomal protein L11 methyltransferase [Woeseiaceae bacterium]